MRTGNQGSHVPARPPAALALTLGPRGMDMGSCPSGKPDWRGTLPFCIRSRLLGENASVPPAPDIMTGFGTCQRQPPEDGAHLWVRTPLLLQSPQGFPRLREDQT